MGLSNSEVKSAKFVSLNSGKKDNTPFFAIKGKKEDGYPILEQYNQIEGSLVAIELSGYEHEGKFKDTVKLTFEDNKGERFVVDAGLTTGVTTSMLNTFAFAVTQPEFNLTIFRIQLYLNKKSYPSVYITDTLNNTFSWKYKPDELPKVQKQTVDVQGQKIEVVIDKPKIDFWKKVVTEEIAPKLSTITHAKEIASAVQREEAPQHIPDNIDDSDTPLPF